MNAYEKLGKIGEGTYGVVLKAKNKHTGQLVAIKKFKDGDESEQVHKTALREIRILGKLKHENVVSLLEVFKRKGKIYLVFEFLERTVLDDIEKYQTGIPEEQVVFIMLQLLRAVEFIHSHNIIHRDIKPENLLMSKNDVLKVCDFGFARRLARPGAKYTDYVATRWYRAPELLVGDVDYSKPVDIWAIGCLFSELLTGLPLFPGDSDIDQLYHIMKCCGRLTARQMDVFSKNPLYIGIQLPEVKRMEPFERKFPHFSLEALQLLKACLAYEPSERPTASQLLQFPFFKQFSVECEERLEAAVERDRNAIVKEMMEFQAALSPLHREEHGDVKAQTMPISFDQLNFNQTHKSKKKSTDMNEQQRLTVGLPQIVSESTHPIITEPKRTQNKSRTQQQQPPLPQQMPPIGSFPLQQPQYGGFPKIKEMKFELGLKQQQSKQQASTQYAHFAPFPSRLSNRDPNENRFTPTPHPVAYQPQSSYISQSSSVMFPVRYGNAQRLYGAKKKR